MHWNQWKLFSIEMRTGNRDANWKKTLDRKKRQTVYERVREREGEIEEKCSIKIKNISHAKNIIAIEAKYNFEFWLILSSIATREHCKTSELNANSTWNRHVCYSHFFRLFFLVVFNFRNAKKNKQMYARECFALNQFRIYQELKMEINERMNERSVEK